jgi:SOS-response transcriptional repressor LexA
MERISLEAGNDAQAGSPRRYEALAFIIEWIVRSGSSPVYGEIARGMNVSETRAKQLVGQLIRERIIEKTPGAQRSLRVRDLSRSRRIVEETLRRIGWVTADPMGPLLQPTPLPQGQLPMLPEIMLLPSIDIAGAS